jgi:hypothetical protein
LTENLIADRYAAAQAVRIAVWGKPEDMALLRPGRKAKPVDTDDNMNEALAAFGLYEVPADG